MVFVGRSKYDNNGRITIMREIADLMNLDKGGDYVEIHVVNGEVIVRKETKKYAGNFDFESEDIKEALLKYEKDRIENFPEITDAEEIERLAREQYEKDRAERLARKKEKP